MTKRLPEPRNAEGSAPRGNQRSTGTPLPSSGIRQGIPPATGYFSPFVPTSGDTAGDTVYYLVSSIFDPRTLQNATTGDRVYSSFDPGHDYRSIWLDLMYQIVFAQFRMRQEPSTTTLVEMLEIIVDTTRMLGIYLTALSMSASRDPDMFARSRVLNLYDAKAEMQSMLASLPLPRYLVELSLKYIGLVDVSGNYNFQNVGFLSVGDYSSFIALYNNVMSKQLAKNFLRQIYPEIGLIGDPDGSRSMPDVLQAFINANYKTSSSGFIPYILADGASDETLRLNSGGLLCHSNRSGVIASTVTGWAVPGSGIGGGTVRTLFPSMCVWKPSSGRDAVITRSIAAQAYSVVGTTVSAESVLNAALAVNMVHEYNMNQDDTSAAGVITAYNGTTGLATVSEVLSTENTRYRCGAGFQLGSLTYDLQANVVSLFRDILLP